MAAMTPEQRVEDLSQFGCQTDHHAYGLADACSGCVLDAIKAAIAEERAACAALAESVPHPDHLTMAHGFDWRASTAQHTAAAIRARGAAVAPEGSAA